MEWPIKWQLKKVRPIRFGRLGPGAVIISNFRVHFQVEILLLCWLIIVKEMWRQE